MEVIKSFVSQSGYTHQLQLSVYQQQWCVLYSVIIPDRFICVEFSCLHNNGVWHDSTSTPNSSGYYLSKEAAFEALGSVGEPSPSFKGIIEEFREEEGIKASQHFSDLEIFRRFCSLSCCKHPKIKRVVIGPWDRLYVAVKA